MSTRLGMADGRCIQDFTPSRILHEELMSRAGINVYDNYSFRQMAQKAGPDGMGLPLIGLELGLHQLLGLELHRLLGEV